MDEAGNPATREAREAALGRHLRALREQRGWTQGTLSRESGVSQATIRAIEANYPNVRRRSRATLIALSRALGLPNDYLIGYQASPPPEELPSHATATGNEPPDDPARGGAKDGKDWPGVIKAIQDRVKAEHISDAELAWRTRLAHNTVTKIWLADSTFSEANLICFSVALGWPPHYLLNILHRQPQGDGEPAYPMPESFEKTVLNRLNEIDRKVDLLIRNQRRPSR
ncbi:MAG: helix-turn-helix transcriptional regulator [Nocardiopsaceae bacterium]|nr:helix-turn-helix transcriptional regulator [Nocardiopsaceae bacterium]